MCLAIPGEVTSVHDRQSMRFGNVRFGSTTREVCLDFEPDTQPGEFVLVHAGFAISRIDRDEAARRWAALQSLGETQQTEEPSSETGAAPDPEVRS